ncbi:hypothetical protein SOASR030_21280 [Leminorella grimontii]|uniref:Type 1 fimbrial protein n=1 Tax=Leminorella grimontii TaxID=82981 RepID=A0AAV5N1M2_9GAMM|nr:fimbrial protein [Leminorella grimontii]KFC96870.1 fimbrial adhesin [Leminorella grimontii ATCC 33999 = DSM 5078]GKX56016.1 hypothetical protein SOASR030_21280 [Leminorella grimontii]GKX59065.1 hypothetical protein SOASR031_13800 [Leminorella grimontii]VFS57701.1 Type-1A pilin [Leminorella grimontii]
MKHLRQLGMFIILLGFLSNVHASCYKGGDFIKTISFGNVIVQRDMPIGSTIASVVTGDYNGGKTMAGCTTDWTYRWERSQWPMLSDLGNKIYLTNLPGVGIRLTNTASGFVLPYDEAFYANEYVILTGNGIKAELIKIGDITGGALDSGRLARASVANQFYFADLHLTGVNNITSVACSVTTPAVNVPLGQRNKSEFSGIGSGTVWQDVNIMLDCNKDARINVRIDAIADRSGLPGVLAIDEQPGDMKAGGIGIQLYYRPDNKPVVFSQETFYYQSLYGGQEIVKLKARYCQTEANIIPGNANGTATFTLSYK